MACVFLLGMPYSGKSTLGKKLAKSLKAAFFDLDVEIEALEGMNVPEIFENRGESYFRDKESKALSTIVQKSDSAVIALGGGTPCYNNNWEILRNSGLSIFLDVEISELLKRADGDTSRPLLNQDDPLESLKRLMYQRRKCYEKADIIISGNNIDLADILRKLTD